MFYYFVVIDLNFSCRGTLYTRLQLILVASKLLEIDFFFFLLLHTVVY